MMTIDKIQWVVCEHYDVYFEQLTGTSRRANIVAARHVYCYLASVITNLNLYKIGLTINRDHSSVLYAREKIRSEIEIYPAIKNDIEILISKIENEIPLVVEKVNLLELSKNYSQSFI